MYRDLLRVRVRRAAWYLDVEIIRIARTRKGRSCFRERIPSNGREILRMIRVDQEREGEREKEECVPRHLLLGIWVRRATTRHRRAVLSARVQHHRMRE